MIPADNVRLNGVWWVAIYGLFGGWVLLLSVEGNQKFNAGQWKPSALRLKDLEIHEGRTYDKNLSLLFGPDCGSFYTSKAPCAYSEEIHIRVLRCLKAPPV